MAAPLENYNYDRTLFDLTIINKYYFSKKEKFGLTINPSLTVNPNTQLYNEIIKYVQTNNNPISFIPLNNDSITLYLNLVVNNLMISGINIFNIDNYEHLPEEIWNKISSGHLTHMGDDKIENGVFIQDYNNNKNNYFSIIYIKCFYNCILNLKSVTVVYTAQNNRHKKRVETLKFKMFLGK